MSRGRGRSASYAHGETNEQSCKGFAGVGPEIRPQVQGSTDKIAMVVVLSGVNPEPQANWPTSKQARRGEVHGSTTGSSRSSLNHRAAAPVVNLSPVVYKFPTDGREPLGARGPVPVTQLAAA